LQAKEAIDDADRSIDKLRQEKAELQLQIDEVAQQLSQKGKAITIPMYYI
jgi:hypothetical protein